MKVRHQAVRKWEGSTSIPLEEMRQFLNEVHDTTFTSKPEVMVEVTADQGQYGKGAQVWLTARWETGNENGRTAAAS
jgi:hypothetical protein